jgi:type I restriction enzyme M protein
MLASMQPKTGRLGVVMPNGVLFRGGAEGSIRQCLIQHDQLEAVIGLGPNLFYGAGIPACLLIFRSTKSEKRRGTVLFVDGSATYTKGRNQNELSATDIELILGAYETGATGEGSVPVRVVQHSEIKENDWDLNIGRYLKTAAAELIDVPTALAELRGALAVLDKAKADLVERLKAAGYELD